MGEKNENCANMIWRPEILRKFKKPAIGLPIAGNGGILTKYMDKRDRPEILWKEEAAVFWQTKAVV